MEGERAGERGEVERQRERNGWREREGERQQDGEGERGGGGACAVRASTAPLPSRTPTLETTQGPIDGFFIQFSFK